ncbi:MAG TPA: globin domain-containing protein [Corynebacterium sp.]|nr:globin domain-containing protein [Corynebacterium sp.]
MYVSTTPDTKAQRLSPEHEELVIATLPAVGANIETITRAFYGRMFTAHPELLRDTFNRGNQKSGAQQKALAASVATFATMLVDPAAPDPVHMLNRIAHKHVSLGITRDQYPIVHEHLMAAIGEVLGEAVTEEIAAAWSTVYWLMAEVLIAQEELLYASDGVTPGDVFREVRVTAKQALTDKVTTYTLEGDLVQPRPGQYTSIGVVLPDGARQLRQYSIVAGDHNSYRIAVETEGEVSAHLKEKVATGDTVQATLAAGDLVLEDGDNPVVLISSGIGSTPIVGMLAYLTRTGSERKITCLVADDNEASLAQKAEGDSLVEQLKNASTFFSYRDRGDMLRPSEHDVAGADVYICGGSAFLKSVREDLESLPGEQAPAQIRYELFSPNDWLVS